METEWNFLVLSFQSFFGKRKIFSKKKNIKAVEKKLEDILSCEEIPIVRPKFYAVKGIVRSFHQKNGIFFFL